MMGDDGKENCTCASASKELAAERQRADAAEAGLSKHAETAKVIAGERDAACGRAKRLEAALREVLAVLSEPGNESVGAAYPPIYAALGMTDDRPTRMAEPTARERLVSQTWSCDECARMALLCIHDRPASAIALEPKGE